jgi:transcriptional regulator with XRE-family HTH domain
MNISEKLKQARAETDLTQEAAAEKIGVSRQTVYNWESGKSYPDLANIMILVDVYNITLDSLLKGDSEMIKHLEEGSGKGKNVRHVIVSVVAVVVVLLGIWLSFAFFGTSVMYFLDPPSLLLLLLPMIFILTITRSFKLFNLGLKSLILPRKPISEEDRTQAISLFRLMSKTVALIAAITMITGFIGIVSSDFYPFSDKAIMQENIYILYSVLLMIPLYSLIMILVIFEPIVFILKKK